MHRYLEDIVLPALNRHTGESLAIEFRRRWDDHKTFTAWMVRMFNFLDKTMTAVGSRSKGPCTTIVSMRKFCEVAFDLKKSEIVAAIQEMINTERGGGGGIDRSLLKSVVGCFITMGCIRGLSSVSALHWSLRLRPWLCGVWRDLACNPRLQRQLPAGVQPTIAICLCNQMSRT